MTERKAVFIPDVGQPVKLLEARTLAHIHGDTEPEGIAKRFGIELLFYEGKAHVTGKYSFALEVRLSPIKGGEPLSKAFQAPTAVGVLSQLDEFDVCRLLPKKTPLAEKQAIEAELRAYFERSCGRLETELERVL